MHHQKQHGFALITALVLVVVLASAITIMTLGTVGDLQQSRASVQLTQVRAVAEAGDVYANNYVMAEQARLSIESLLNTYATAFLAAGSDPNTTWVIPASDWESVRSQIQQNLNTNYANIPAAVTVGGTATSSFTLSKFRGVSRTPTSQVMVADYAIVTTGKTATGSQRRIETNGSLNVQLGRKSLSQYVFLVDDAKGNQGFFPTGTVFNGPVHANSNWGFWGTPQFLDEATTSSDFAYYYDKSFQPHQVYGDSYPPVTVPVFKKGFTRHYDGGNPIILPTNSISQSLAALGLNAQRDANHDKIPDPPTNVEICQALRLKTPIATCASSPPAPATGVYLVNDGSTVNGGIYVQGNIDNLVMASVPTGKQTYTFTQGTNTWTITVDYVAKTTTIAPPSPAPAKTYTGVPNGPSPVGMGGATGQIFVNGAITSVRGPTRTGPLPANPTQHPVPSQVPPALSLETQLNVTATSSIGLTGDITYECDPTIPTGARCTNGPIKTVLGMMSQSSSMNIKTTAPDNLYLWGSYLTGTSGTGLKVDNYNSRPAQGNLNLFGGLIQSVDQLRGTINGNGTLRSGYNETYDYDKRFANSALTPPNFPTTQTFSVTASTPIPFSFQER